MFRGTHEQIFDVREPASSTAYKRLFGRASFFVNHRRAAQKCSEINNIMSLKSMQNDWKQVRKYSCKNFCGMRCGIPDDFYVSLRRGARSKKSLHRGTVWFGKTGPRRALLQALLRRCAWKAMIDLLHVRNLLVVVKEVQILTLVIFWMAAHCLMCSILSLRTSSSFATWKAGGGDCFFEYLSNLPARVENKLINSSNCAANLPWNQS